MVAITTTYATALVICLLIMAIYPPKTDLVAAFRHLNWTNFALPLSIVGIEFGFLLAFRAGWQVSLTALIVNAVGTVLLVPIGLAFFKDMLSPVNLIGSFLCRVGQVMMNWEK